MSGGSPLWSHMARSLSDPTHRGPIHMGGGARAYLKHLGSSRTSNQPQVCYKVALNLLNALNWDFFSRVD